MHITRLPNGMFHMELSEIELGTIGNCLNEVCNGIDVTEFQTRIGVSREEVKALLQEIVSSYRM
jgi:hypothetical protein